MDIRGKEIWGAAQKNFYRLRKFHPNLYRFLPDYDQFLQAFPMFTHHSPLSPTPTVRLSAQVCAVAALSIIALAMIQTEI